MNEPKRCWTHRVGSIHTTCYEGANRMDYEEYLIVKLSAKEVVGIFDRIAIDAQTGCWIWTGARSNGRARIIHYDRPEQVHRVLYAWRYGPIPRGDPHHRNLVLDHLCNNGLCVNPDHLKMVTQKENVLRADSISGRNSRKTRCPRGHTLPTEPNRPDGSRRCLDCQREDNRKNYQNMAEGLRVQKNLYLREYRKRQKPTL